MRTSGWVRSELRPHQRYVGRGKSTELRGTHCLRLDVDLFVFATSIPSNFITVDLGAVVVRKELVVASRDGTWTYVNEILIVPLLHFRRLGSRLLAAPYMAPTYHSSGRHTNIELLPLPPVALKRRGTGGVSAQTSIDMSTQPNFDGERPRARRTTQHHAACSRQSDGLDDAAGDGDAISYAAGRNARGGGR